MIRVAHVITRLELGGAQDNTLHTVAHLRPPYDAHLLAGPGGILDVEARVRLGDALTFVPSLVHPIRPVRDLLAVRDLARAFRRLRPAIVHTHSSKAGIVGRAAARLAGVPVVVHSIHGFGFHDRQAAWLRRALIAAERIARPWTTHFVSVAGVHLARGTALGIVDPERASVVRSGVHLGALAAAADRAARSGTAALRAGLGFPAQGPIVGMVACLKPQKAPLDFVEAAARVASRRPDATFVMVGDGPLRAAVEARARALGLDGRLHLLGWRRDVPDLLPAFDVVTLTSLWEGLPRVVPEAIAAGRPLVVTAVDGAAELLRHEEHALLVPPSDPGAVAGQILRLLEEPALARRLVGSARPLLAEFDIDRMVREQESLYARLLQGVAEAALTGPADGSIVPGGAGRGAGRRAA
ncbi:MAG TPA: glycosyltransferase family 4 protein [Candidatus Polarisedimenticolia bacterium]|nr:glycosyltransferase family 4 protein [Candidatus Polarisedimenticolia bacterium]